MNSEEKKAVAEHIIKIAGFDNTTKGYQAIKLLFDKNEWDFWMLREPQLHRDLAIWLQNIGLKVLIRADKVLLENDAINEYYKNILGMTPEPKEAEKSYCERYNIIVKKD
ncbi:hypothetical protein [Flavobacterium piscisymbiosum]|uniref:Uncharacterized protein n=1 Tax=Flavobacterium piscisymbiosum TaxID=2893753 RepID=A0ABS8MLD0_9FLAO|nr:hypothetical protein [Flavobacterium sp. F-30]MCC9066300.1 hypothetical protein [Flavobacterium sp. F-30]